MAPEQARGEAADQRADIYAIGLILYDMLLGRRRHEHADSAIAELRTRLETALPPPRTVDESVPEALDRIIGRCIAPKLEDRYQTTLELVADLDRLDAEGRPLPSQRRMIHSVVAGSILLIISMFAVNWWLVKSRAPATAHAPVSVLVADFDDKTNSPVFKGTLEQALTTGMEGAAFITAYSRADAVRLAAEIKPGRRLDAEMARLVSTRESIKVVLAGTVERSGRGYSVKVDAIDAAAGQVLSSARASAASPERILAAVSTVATDLRSGLGDTAAERALPAGAAEDVTASSLQALQAYARAQELQASRQDEQALAAYQEAIRLDPNLGRAYSGMGVLYFNMGDAAKSKAAYEKALRLVDRMSDREKYRTLGGYYVFVGGNYEKAVENFEALVKLYPADEAGHSNLAVAYMFTGNLKGSIEQARQVLRLDPRSMVDRYNYAMYALYTSDFDTAIGEGTRVAKESPGLIPGGLLPVALARVLQGDHQGALTAYGGLEQASPSGASRARFGRADLLMYQGRYTEALNALQGAVAEDTKAGNNGWLARDHVAVAEACLALGQKPRAADSARKAASLTDSEAVLIPAALALVSAGRLEEAEKIAGTLENRLQTLMTAYAKLISAQVAFSQERPAAAIELFRDSIKLRDTWLARFLLGRLYSETGHFPEAMAELEASVKRRGEAADILYTDTPTTRYFPPGLYWLARAQEALGAADARKQDQQFLAARGNAAPPDPLVIDARKRLAALAQ